MGLRRETGFVTNEEDTCILSLYIYVCLVLSTTLKNKQKYIIMRLEINGKF